MTAFLIAASILLFGVGVIWSREHVVNVLFKLMFLGMGIWGGILALEALGYIVKV